MDNTIKLGASYTIGSHILPGETIIQLRRILGGKIKLTIANCDKIIEGIKAREFDLGLIESPIFDDALEYKKWMEDELVVCSKAPLGDNIDADKIGRCQLLCRVESSPTRQFITNFFKEQGLSYHSFDSLMEVDNATSAIQGIKWSKPDRESPTVAIVSKLAIEDELEKKELHEARIGGKPMIRNFYLIYDKQDGDSAHVDEIITYLKTSH